MPEFVTIKNIPICATGIEYKLSTGPKTFTETDLEDAIEAANTDVSVKSPRMKLGHAKAGWQAGEPNFGNYYNLSLSANRQEILADLDTYDWLAEVLPIAYPNRSIEGAAEYTAETGREYGLIITAVSCLGVELPGVSSLEDLRELVENPEVVIVARTEQYVGASKAAVVVRGQVDADDVRRAFMRDVATGDRYWWWIRSIRLSPDEIIVEDEDEGKMYRIPFTVDGHDVTFAEATVVYEEFVDAPASEQEDLPSTVTSQVLASWSEAASSRSGTNREELRVGPKTLRKKLGLPSDATEEQLEAALDQLVSATEGDEEEDEGTSVTPPADGDDDADSDDDTDEETNEDTEPPTPTVASGAVTIDPETLAQLQADAVAGRVARKQQIDAERKTFMEAAVKDGKFPPSRIKHYSALHEKDPKGTEDFINQLASGVIPVTERGANPPSDDEQVTASTDYPAAWLSPKELERVRRHDRGRAA